MTAFLQDVRYAASHAATQRGPDAGDRRVARDRHRRQHRDLQRRQRAAAEAAALSRIRIGWRCCGCGRRASTFRRTGRRPGSTSTSRTRTDRSKRCRSRRGAPARCSGSSEPRARRGAADLVEPVPPARREAALRPAAAARRRRAGQAAGRRSSVTASGSASSTPIRASSAGASR